MWCLDARLTGDYSCSAREIRLNAWCFAAGYAPQVPQTGYAAPQQGYVPPTAAPVQQGVYVQVAGPETVGATAGQAYYKVKFVLYIFCVCAVGWQRLTIRCRRPE